MRFRNSLHLLMGNFKQVYKLLLYKLIIGVVAAALTAAFILPELSAFMDSAEVQALWYDIKVFLKTLVSLEQTKLGEAKEAILGDGGSLQAVGQLLSTMTLEIVLMCLGVSLVYLVRRFVDTLCHFASGSMLNDKMSSYADTSFSSSSIVNLGKASRYALVYVPLVFVYDLFTLFLAYLLLANLQILLALSLSVTLIVLSQSLKLTVTSHWLPAMTTDDMPLKKALRRLEKEERSQKIKLFSTYVVSVYLVIIVNVLAALCTFGSALLITVPASYFLFICIQYVNYYTVKGKKYFITYDQIASGSDHTDSKNFFEQVVEMEKTEETAATATENEENKA